jgi:AcrR family transcriptional regulator
MGTERYGAGSEAALAHENGDRGGAAVARLGHRIRQKRGRRTYEHLMQTAFELLEHGDLETITIAALTRAAGYSVGAFYARFRSKDEFFEAMLAEHIAERMAIRNRLFLTLPDDELVKALIVDLVTSYWRRRRFWRAALIRGARDPALWLPVRELGQAFADALVSRITERIRRPLTSVEKANVSFAFQIARGAINNAIINRPGPVFMGRAAFIDNLERAFRLVAGYDRLMRLDQRRAQSARPPVES